MLALVLAQIVSFYFIRNIKSFWALFPLAYFIGGVTNHAIMLAIHEISHGMAFGAGRPNANKWFAIFANLPIGVPMSISFKKYHLEHHRYQGDELLDTDIPTNMEAAFFTSSIRKLCWCILQPFFYTMRPLFVHPKPIEKYELYNFLAQMSFDALIVTFLGWHVLAYMIGGTILAMGLHPVAGHFISEHTLLFQDKEGTNQHHQVKAQLTNGKHDSNSCNNNDNTSDNQMATTVDPQGQFLIPETCSYYGPLNRLTFNVGYHVEHHDFPSIPGSRLPMLSKIAPEFYSTLNYHTSWTKVLWQYITDPKVGPSARVRRPHSLQSHRDI